jgi:hypothetical protein
MAVFLINRYRGLAVLVRAYRSCVCCATARFDRTRLVLTAISKHAPAIVAIYHGIASASFLAADK